MKAKPAVLTNLLFFCSGFSCLVFEAVWSRLLIRALGAGSTANACVFSAFMAGAAVGAYFASQRPDLLEKCGRSKNSVDEASNYLRAYGRMELLAGTAGIALSAALAHGSSSSLAQFIGLFQFNDWMETAARFFSAFFLLLLPCSAMGAGLAAISSYNKRIAKHQSFPLLYAANTAGAALGCWSVAFWFIPQLGLHFAWSLAGVLALIVFISAEVQSKTERREKYESSAENCAQSTGSSEDLLDENQSQKIPGSILAAVALSGSTVLILELIWTRIFSVLLGASSYSLGIVLLIILLTCSASSFMVSRLRIFQEKTTSSIAICFYLAGISILFEMYAVNLMQMLFINISGYLAPFLTQDILARVMIARFILGLILIAPPTFFLSAILPLGVLHTSANSGKLNNHASLLYSVNCFGSAIGCLGFAVALFPLLSSTSNFSLQLSMHILAAISLLTSAALVIYCQDSDTQQWKFARYTTVMGGLALSFLLANQIPEWDQKNLSSGALIYGNNIDSANDTREIIELKDGINSTVVLAKSASSNSLSLSSDGKVESTLAIDRSLISPGSDLSTHIMLGELPMLFHKQPSKDVLLIGLGSGVSASSILSFPGVEHLTVAELEPAVISLCKKYLNQFNGGLFSKKCADKLTIRATDARFLLNSNNSRFDVIVSQPADPWVAGSGDLFTREFWQLGKNRLRENGLFCQWIQLYAIPSKDLLSIINTFQSEFPSTYIFHAPGAGEVILLGSTDQNFNFEVADTNAIEAINNRMAAAIKENRLLASSGISSFYDAASIAERIAVDSHPFNKPLQTNSDNQPFIEFSTSKSVLTGEQQLQNNLDVLKDLISTNSATSKFKGNSHIHCEMARAYARLYRAEQEPFKARAAALALMEVRVAQRLSSDDETAWTKILVDRACTAHPPSISGESSAEHRIESNKPLDYWNKLAAFDKTLDSKSEDAAKSAKSVLNAIHENTSAAWLRRGFYDLMFGSTKSARDNFERALQIEPASLPALLGSFYSLKACEEPSLARTRLEDYLKINPWDFDSQLAYTNELVLANDLNSANKHAECSFQLRPFDASAYILLLNAQLNDANHWNIKQSTDKISAASRRNPSLEKITRSFSLQSPDSLKHSQQFAELVAKTIHQAEDSKNGYKMLGEP